jgi:transposase InsO family protein
MVERTTNDRAFRILNIIDKFTREYLALLVACKTNTRCDRSPVSPFLFWGVSKQLRSDNGPEFTAGAIRA